MKDINKIWEDILALLKETLTETSYRTWFLPIIPKNIDEQLKILYLEIPDEFTLGVIKQRYEQTLHDKAEQVIGERYRIIVQLMEEDEDDLESSIAAEVPSSVTFPQDNVEKIETTNSETPEKLQISMDISKENKPVEPVNNILKDEVYFNPRYNFDNFVVGNNNKYAYSAAFAVAKSPSVAYNPLFIYGGSGLGKTHLMHAIGHYIMENYPEKKVLYVSSEMFTNELIRSLEDNKKTKMRAFKNKYRNVDVLLIDDIQFIEGKEATQEEFFHTFNDLHGKKKQIIISSDKPPKDIETLEARLRSRFEWGLIADISSPDFETRMAILHKKEETDGYDIDNEVIKYIAMNIKSNIRELEGALNKLVALSNLENREITVKLAEEALKDIISPDEKKEVTPAFIISTVAEHFHVSVDDIRSNKRNTEIVVPRQIAMYLCSNLTSVGLKKIGSEMGGRDHSTVLHGSKKISSELKTSEDMRKTIEILKKKINPS